MIAKEIAMPRTGGSFRGLVTYLTSPRGKSERVGRVQLTNCVSADVASAVLEVEATQGRNGRARHRTYHLMLSFREHPAPSVLEAIERRACAALGFHEHQRVSVVHHDTDHFHVHIAINRVHPKTHRVHCPSYSKLALDRLCVELEREYGLVTDRHRTRGREAQLDAVEALRTTVRRDCAEALRQARSWDEIRAIGGAHGLRLGLRGNGLVLTARDGTSLKASSVGREFTKVALERRLGPFPSDGSIDERSLPRPSESNAADRRPHDMERLAGVESLKGWIQRGCAEALRNARSWEELHKTAAEHGLSVRLRGNGVVFVTAEGLAVKASSVSRELSKSALERRLGAFDAGTSAVTIRRQYSKRPIARDEAGLYERYLRERALALEQRSHPAARLREQRARDHERLRRISQRRWAAVRLLAKGQLGWMLWSAYARQADRRDRDRARQRRQAAARAAAALAPRASWVDWLRQRAAVGDAEALAALRRRKEATPSKAESMWVEASPKQLVKLTADSVTATGTVIYRVRGGSIRDDGRRLNLAATDGSDNSAAALLQMAHARFGSRIGVEGDESFRARVVRAAVRSAAPITFADEQLERHRIEMQRKEQADAQQPTRGRERHARPDRAIIAAGGVVGARLGKPHAVDARREAPAKSIADLRRLSSIPVLRFGGAPPVLLPADARRHVDKRDADRDFAVRPGGAEHGVRGERGRKGGRR